MEAIILTTIFLLFVLLVFVILISYHIRARRHVFGWADKNNYKILRLRNLPFRGPFFFNSSQAHRVFRAELLMEDGSVEKAYLKIGNFWNDVLKLQIEVKWDREKNKKLP